MWFSFRITRGIRVGLPWWAFPIVLVALVVELAFYVIVGAFVLVGLGIGKAVSRGQHRRSAG